MLKAKNISKIIALASLIFFIPVVIWFIINTNDTAMDFIKFLGNANNASSMDETIIIDMSTVFIIWVLSLFTLFFMIIYALLIIFKKKPLKRLYSVSTMGISYGFVVLFVGTFIAILEVVSVAKDPKIIEDFSKDISICFYVLLAGAIIYAIAGIRKINYIARTIIASVGLITILVALILLNNKAQFNGDFKTLFILTLVGFAFAFSSLTSFFFEGLQNKNEENLNVPVVDASAINNIANQSNMPSFTQDINNTTENK